MRKLLGGTVTATALAVAIASPAPAAPPSVTSAQPSCWVALVQDVVQNTPSGQTVGAFIQEGVKTFGGRIIGTGISFAATSCPGTP